MAHDLVALLQRARRALATPTRKAVPDRYNHIDFSPPEGVRAALRRGLDLHEEGHSGDGLKFTTVAWARRLAGGEAISPEKARDMAAWFARHRAQGKPDRSGEPTPKLVSDLLWGGDPGQAWSGKLVEQMDAADRLAEKAALPSLADRARAALARLRAVPASKEAITTADLGLGATPPQVGVDERDKFRPGVQEVRPVVVGEIAPAQAAAPEEDTGPPSELPAKLVDFGGIPVLVDRPKGFVQTKLGPDGAVLWTRTYLVDYGGLAGTDGGDHELLDVFLGPDPTATTAWWCVQVDDAGAFDEYKLLLGFVDEAAARACYVAHIPERYLVSMAPMPVERLRALLGLPVLTLDPVTKASSLLDAIGEATGTRQRVDLVASTKAAAPDEQYIFGVVLMPEKTDLQGEIYAASVVRKTAHDYLAFFRNTDIQHKAYINDAVDLVESTTEKVAFWMARDGTSYPADAAGQPIGAPAGAQLRFVPKGSWTVAHRVKDPELWAAIKAGKYTGYSINGLKKLAPSIAAPPAPA